MGGQGSPRSYRLAARYADEFNLSSSSPDKAIEVAAALDEACRAIDRDPSTLARSTMAGVLVGRDQDEVDARERDLVKAFGQDMEAGEAWLEERRNRWVYGTPDQAREQLAAVRRGGPGADHAPGLLALGPGHIDVMGEELVGRA